MKDVGGPEGLEVNWFYLVVNRTFDFTAANQSQCHKRFVSGLRAVGIKF